MGVKTALKQLPFLREELERLTRAAHQALFSTSPNAKRNHGDIRHLRNNMHSALIWILHFYYFDGFELQLDNRPFEVLECFFDRDATHPVSKHSLLNVMLSYMQEAPHRIRHYTVTIKQDGRIKHYWPHLVCDG